MAIATGNISNGTVTASHPYTSVTVSHTQDTGADRLLVVHIMMQNVSDFNGVTYGGDAMTLETSYEWDSQDFGIFTLTNPSQGANDLVINFASLQANPVAYWIQSFLGTSGVGNLNTFTDYSTPSPRTEVISVSNNSFIMCSGYSTQPGIVSQFTIGGQSEDRLFQEQTSRYYYGAINSNPLTAGSKDCTIDMGATWKNTTVNLVEIQESGSTPTPPNNNFLIMF